MDKEKRQPRWKLAAAWATAGALFALVVVDGPPKADLVNTIAIKALGVVMLASVSAIAAIVYSYLTDR